MKMYCHYCWANVKIKKIKEKTNREKSITYICKKCGMRLWKIIEHRRKELR
jgi:predicted SprT family Zn-dependent metalloprotease